MSRIEPGLINENDLAREISVEEGGLVNLPIGQVKEVQKILLEKLGEFSDYRILTLINKHREKEFQSRLEPLAVGYDLYDNFTSYMERDQ